MTGPDIPARTASTTGPRDGSTSLPRLHPAGRILLALTVVQFGLVFAQAVFAGNLLSGSATSRLAHEVLGTQVLTVVALGQVVAAGIDAWRGRGTISVVAMTTVLFAAITWQGMLGFGGRLALHVPLGVAILLAQPAMAIGIVRHRTPLPSRLVVAILAAIISGCATSPGTATVETGPAASSAILIEAVDNAFDPTDVEIPDDEPVTIEITNLGDAPHDLVARDIDLDTGLLQPGQTVHTTVTINRDTEFTCTIHPGMGGRLTTR